MRNTIVDALKILKSQRTHIPSSNQNKNHHKKMLKKRTNWSQLPPDLLQLITTLLPESTDLLRLRSVCRPWRSSIPLLPKTLPPFLLLLLLSKPPPPCNKTQFFSLSETRTYDIPLPEFKNHQIFSSQQGHLIAVSHRPVDDNKTVEFIVSLFNPITRISIPLPCLLMQKAQVNLPITRHVNVKLFGPETDIVVGFLPVGRNDIVYWCRPGDSAWSQIGVSCYISKHPHDEFCLFNGCVYIVDLLMMSTEIVSMENVRYDVGIPPVWKGGRYDRRVVRSFGSSYLVESPFGELLLVLRNKQWFQIFRWEESESEGEVEWVKISCIGECTIFVTRGFAMCFALSDVKGCRRNCVYFVDEDGVEAAVWLYEIGTDLVKRTCFPPWRQWISVK